MSCADVIGLFIRFVLLYTPFFVISVFIPVTQGMEHRARRRLALRVGLAVAVISAVLYLGGEQIFRCLGISLDAFRIGAGTVLMLNGIELVRSSAIPSGRQVDAETDMAVVPLAIPYTAGPGTIGTLLVMGADPGLSIGNRMITLGTILAASAVVGLMLCFSEYIERALKKKGVAILTKLTGMYLVALAAEIIFTGIGNFLKL